MDGLIFAGFLTQQLVAVLIVFSVVTSLFVNHIHKDIGFPWSLRIVIFVCIWILCGVVRYLAIYISFDQAMSPTDAYLLLFTFGVPVLLSITVVSIVYSKLIRVNNTELFESYQS